MEYSFCYILAYKLLQNIYTFPLYKLRHVLRDNFLMLIHIYFKICIFVQILKNVNLHFCAERSPRSVFCAQISHLPCSYSSLLSVFHCSALVYWVAAAAVGSAVSCAPSSDESTSSMASSEAPSELAISGPSLAALVSGCKDVSGCKGVTDCVVVCCVDIPSTAALEGPGVSVSGLQVPVGFVGYRLCALLASAAP